MGRNGRIFRRDAHFIHGESPPVLPSFLVPRLDHSCVNGNESLEYLEFGSFLSSDSLRLELYGPNPYGTTYTERNAMPIITGRVLFLRLVTEFRRDSLIVHVRVYATAPVNFVLLPQRKPSLVIFPSRFLCRWNQKERESSSRSISTCFSAGDVNNKLHMYTLQKTIFFFILQKKTDVRSSSFQWRQ